MSRNLAVAIVTLLFPIAAQSAGQSLGDVAKKEGDRRQGVKSSGKVISNRDLPTVPPPSSAPPIDPTPSASGGSSEPAVKDDTASKPEEKGDAKDQKYWAGRMKALHASLERDRIFADSLQSRINALTTDFANRDNPVQRDQIARDRQTAINELDRVKKSVTDGTKAIADLEEEARRSGVPAGWLR